LRGRRPARTETDASGHRFAGGIAELHSIKAYISIFASNGILATFARPKLPKMEGQMKPRFSLIAVAASAALLAACAQQEEVEVPVQVEPIYDKYGNAIYVPAPAGAGVVVVNDGGGSGTVPSADNGGAGGDDGGDDTNDDGGQNRNQNQNTNQNTNQTETNNENRNQNQSGN
jgi:hypothetical protein